MEFEKTWAPHPIPPPITIDVKPIVTVKLLHRKIALVQPPWGLGGRSRERTRQHKDGNNSQQPEELLSCPFSISLLVSTRPHRDASKSSIFISVTVVAKLGVQYLVEFVLRRNFSSHPPTRACTLLYWFQPKAS